LFLGHDVCAGIETLTKTETIMEKGLEMARGMLIWQELSEEYILQNPKS
jgi:EAL domain-containing protein (putative c-di-GMP-specific phosphodiesterase class I)